MTVHYTDDWLTVLLGDCREELQTLPDESVHCVVTSPPYWGLRDYGTAAWEGGDAECDHRPAPATGATQNKGNNNREAAPHRSICGKCGARRIDSQLGLEPTPEAYVAAMVAVFREVRRVLRKDGTCWINLGSSYASGDSGPSRSRPLMRAPAYGTDGTGPLGSPGPDSAYSGLCDGCRAVLSSRTTGKRQPPRAAASQPSPTGRDTEQPGSELGPAGVVPLDVPVSTTPRSEPPLPGSCSHCDNCGACLSVLGSSSRDARECARSSWLNYTTFKPKDLIPTPWMLAFALQADGWYLRSDIIWAKPNPMPESVTDRPTKSHEYVFLLSRSPRYYWDAEAVREPSEPWAANHPDSWATGMDGGHDTVRWSRRDPGAATAGNGESRSGRNLRSVWSIATQPYPGAHFATFPEALVEPCIKAGTSERGVCPECGAPWVRETRVRERPLTGASNGIAPENRARGERTADPTGRGGNTLAHGDVRTIAWLPSCGCANTNGPYADNGPHLPIPATVLDPFAGSGTVGRVANRLSRRAILIDLSSDYLDQAMLRNAQSPLGMLG